MYDSYCLYSLSHSAMVEISVMLISTILLCDIILLFFFDYCSYICLTFIYIYIYGPCVCNKDILLLLLYYLKANYSGYFKLEQIRNHFNDYSSFKIEAPLTLKSKLLNKYNWNADVYVRPFFKKSRNY